MREEQLQEEQCIRPHGIVGVRGISLVDKLVENVVWENMRILWATFKEARRLLLH